MLEGSMVSYLKSFPQTLDLPRLFCANVQQSYNGKIFTEKTDAHFTTGVRLTAVKKIGVKKSVDQNAGPRSSDF